MNKEAYNTYHIFFKNLANPLRIRIISTLKDNEMSVSELSKRISAEQSKLSHALSHLRACNLVMIRASGKKRIYSLNKKTLLPILEIIDGHSKYYCKKCRGCK